MLLKCIMELVCRTLLNCTQFYSISTQFYSILLNFTQFLGMWEEAHALAKRHMGASEVSSMYISQAQALEQQGKFREAEKLYISVQESDLAISMYKKQRHYDQMMRLVQQYHPDLVQSTHIHLAQELEQEVRPLNSKYLVHTGSGITSINYFFL